MTEITINTENLTVEDVKLLAKLYEKSLEKPIWKPQVRQEFYFLNDAGNVASSFWANDAIDAGSWSIGNVFATSEKAEFAAEKLKVIAELKRYAEKHNDKISWKYGNSCKYYFVYDYVTKRIEIFPNYSVKHSDIYFSSEEIAKDAIKEIGEERIKKYYLEVND